MKFLSLYPEYGINIEHVVPYPKHYIPPPFSYIHFNNMTFDKNGYCGNLRADLYLLYQIEKKPDAIFACVQRYPELFDDLFVLKKLRENNIPIVFIWFDTILESIKDRIIRYKEYCPFQIIMDNPIPFDDSLIYRWGPITNDFYTAPLQEKTIDVSFVGNQYENRKEYLDKLKNIQCFGGIGYDWKNQTLCDIFRKSKITINFSLDAFGKNHQLKGRVYEALTSECLLLEMDNPLTEKMFTPFEDYVPWKNLDDLSKKIEYYLKNTKEREKIVKNGRKKSLKKYDMKNWWKKLF